MRDDLRSFGEGARMMGHKTNTRAGDIFPGEKI